MIKTSGDVAVVVQDPTAIEKANFHRAWRESLRQLAKNLGLERGTYEVRSLYGGPGVKGDVVLHHDRFYVCVTGQWNGGCRIYTRTCRGRSDYTGGANVWTTPAGLLDTCRRLLAAKGAP